MLPVEPEHILRLRREIADPAALEATGSRAFGVPAIDAWLGGGLARAALHELSAAPTHLGALAGVALILAALAREPRKQALWITTDFGELETGALYGPGLNQFGLVTEGLLLVRVTRPVDALFAMEEALKCTAVATVVAEFNEPPDLTATRRIALAARHGSGIGLMLRHRIDNAPTTAQTRWRVAPALSVPDKFGGLGRTAFTLSLTRNRRGPCGDWTLSWDHHEHTLSLGVDAAAADGQDQAVQG